MLDFSTKYLPSVVSRQALDLHNNHPFPWDFPRESAQTTPQGTRGTQVCSET